MSNFFTGLLPMLAAAGLIAFYILILKPKQDAKAKKQSKGRTDINARSAKHDTDKEWPEFPY